MQDDYIFKTIETYDSTAQEYTRKGANYAPAPERDEFMATLPPGGKILDAGCGPGRDTKYFIDHGFEVTGIDLSKEFLKIAHAAVPKATFLPMDLRSITFRANFFNGIWACASLLHIKKIEIPSVLSKFYEILKPGGTLFVFVKEGVGERFASGLISENKDKFYTYFLPEELLQFVTQTGFHIDKIATINQKDRWPERPSVVWISCLAKK